MWEENTVALELEAPAEHSDFYKPPPALPLAPPIAPPATAPSPVQIRHPPPASSTSAGICRDVQSVAQQQRGKRREQGRSSKAPRQGGSRAAGPQAWRASSTLPESVLGARPLPMVTAQI